MRYLTQKLKRSRDERIEESMKSPQKIDISVDMRFPLSNSTNTKKYKCYMCGESWDSQKSHFSKSDIQNIKQITDILKYAMIVVINIIKNL